MKHDIIATAMASVITSRKASGLCTMALAVAAVMLAGCGEQVEGLPPVTLVGERAGVLVWNAVPEATNYRMDIVDSTGTVRVAHAAPDTIAQLPPDFSTVRGDQWWVRAYNGTRIIAASKRAPLY